MYESVNFVDKDAGPALVFLAKVLERFEGPDQGCAATVLVTQLGGEVRSLEIGQLGERSRRGICQVGSLHRTCVRGGAKSCRFRLGSATSGGDGGARFPHRSSPACTATWPPSEAQCSCLAMSPPATSTASALSASLSLVGLQVVSRLFSFALNQLLLRSTSPQAFGVATIQLDTLVGTVLFFVREGLRGAVAVEFSSPTLPSPGQLWGADNLPRLEAVHRELVGAMAREARPSADRRS